MSVGTAYSKIRLKLAMKAAKILPDTCRLIIEGVEQEGGPFPCRFGGNAGDIDGAPYRIEFAWGSLAVIGATAIVDEITGRPQLTLQLVEPVDSSTSLWQEWKATSGPAFGRVDVGL